MMRVGYFARLVCPDDPTDMILYAMRKDVPAHLHDDLYRLACWAEKLGDYVETECGHLCAGPVLLEDEGRAVGPWDWVLVEGGWMAEGKVSSVKCQVSGGWADAGGVSDEAWMRALLMGSVSG